jgi:hypothetical protein
MSFKEIMNILIPTFIAFSIPVIVVIITLLVGKINSFIQSKTDNEILSNFTNSVITNITYVLGSLNNDITNKLKEAVKDDGIVDESELNTIVSDIVIDVYNMLPDKVKTISNTVLNTLEASSDGTGISITEYLEKVVKTQIQEKYNNNNMFIFGTADDE